MIRRIIKGFYEVIKQEITWFKTRRILHRQTARLVR
jgi:hypothetical protein